MNNIKIMTAHEWLNQKYERRVTYYENPLKSMEEYAEYYHSEQMKRVGNDAESIKRIAMNIVNQLFDEVKASVDTRQSINDKCDSFVVKSLTELWQHKPSDSASDDNHAINFYCFMECCKPEDVFMYNGEWLTLAQFYELYKKGI